MAKDDYFVLVYKILAYLYTKLKEGQPPDPKLLTADGPLLKINERYWTYIMQNLQEQGFITGLTLSKAQRREIIIFLLKQYKPEKERQNARFAVLFLCRFVKKRQLAPKSLQNLPARKIRAAASRR